MVKVTRGWRNLREINTVTYDPAKISVTEMTDHLKAAGTFGGLAE
ncbi:MAG: hypothetical protein QNJ22_24465 [Desulfosarcinaceae bacterium]|nr:hypothetical protein [Desulfosarcinaceae bacterium]